ncbi:MAG: rhamnulokinase [Clostridium sp.]|nr:rhamnulokinase [Clostridium sp.]
MTKEAFIAVDYGGGSGRVIAGTVSPSGEITLDEIHRFKNRQVRLGRHLYWDFPALFAEMTEGLRKAVASGYRIRSVAVDTWGVDFGLVDRNGNLLGLPVCYRDEATAVYPERFAETHDIEAHYRSTGIQVMEINTLYRLAAMRDEFPELFSLAEHLLFTPDLFSFYLTGTPNVEYTIASTSEMLDARSRDWDRTLIDSLGLPQRLFGQIVMPGTIRGWLTEEIRRQIGADYEIPVLACGSHDTASAAHASQTGTNPDGTYTAFLSSGTWSLLGVRLPEPVLTEKARLGGFSNEGGVGGILLLQNITGLWLLQQLSAQWEATGRGADFPTLVAEAEAARTEAIIDVDDPVFARQTDMEKEITGWCSARGIEPPKGRGEMTRCVVRSLARRYARGIAAMNELLPAPVTRLNIIGGGSLNRFLNAETAREAGVEVIAGPAEATAIGSIRLQAESLR